MDAIEKIHVSPVKSMGLIDFDEAHISEHGILEDRRFFVMDAENKLVTQRQIGKLTQILADYLPRPEELALQFPDGHVISGEPGLGQPMQAMIWGRFVTGNVVEGDFNDAVSEFCGQPLRIVRAHEPGTSYDEFPISIMSQATIDHLSSLTDGKMDFDSRRFRPTLLLSGAEVLEEDDWLGQSIRIGRQVRLRLVSRDPRCAITTLDPSTGERDFDTLRLILDNRPGMRAAYLGVYAAVEQSGTVAVGDEVEAL
jgi:uncharacterized protein YcbX